MADLQEAHFRLDGASYLSTPDINLLDADTAHLQQSIGDWQPIALTTTPTLSTDVAPEYGLFTMKVVADETFTGLMQVATADDTVLIVGDSTYSLLVRLRAMSDDAWRAQTRLVWYNSVGSQIGVTPEGVGNGGTEFFEISVNGVAPATAATAKIELRLGNTAGHTTIGDTFYVDVACVRTDTDPSFVPSLRIVGDLDMEARVAPTLATPAGSGIMTGFYFTAGYSFSQKPDGTIRLFHKPSGGTSADASSTVAAFTVDEKAHDVRIAWSRSATEATFYRDGSQLGAPVGTSLPSDVYDVDSFGRQKGMIGARTTGDEEVFSGDIFSASTHDGIGGPAIVNITPQGAPAGAITDGATWQGPDGRTWTAHGNVINVPADTGGYFTLDGVAGTYISTPDVTRHMGSRVRVLGRIALHTLNLRRGLVLPFVAQIRAAALLTVRSQVLGQPRWVVLLRMLRALPSTWYVRVHIGSLSWRQAD